MTGRAASGGRCGGPAPRPTITHIVIATTLAVPLPAFAQQYAFPTSADDYGSFYPTAYVDHGGVTDWNCGGTTYSGHRGSDYGGGSWSGMDAGRDITAAAPGTVIAVNDGVDDGCSTGDCGGGGGFGNYVKIQHADGKSTYYAHLKTWSLTVANGQYVTCGQKLGEMGSSGNSTGPHVHFEVRTSSGSASDPFDGTCSDPPSYWVSQGSWGGLPSITCEDVPDCAQVDRLRCGQTIGTANNAGGATSSHAAYGCGEYTYSGPEIAYAFATELTEAVTINVSGNTSDVDLFVLGSTACDGSSSVGCSISPNADAEAVTFTATAGYVYTVVVDGYEGAVTGFNLSAACAGAYPGESVPDPVDTGTADTDLDTDLPADTALPGGDTALSEGDTAPALADPGEWTRLDLLGCGGPAGGVLIVGALAGVGRRRRRG